MPPALPSGDALAAADDRPSSPPAAVAPDVSSDLQPPAVAALQAADPSAPQADAGIDRAANRLNTPGHASLPDLSRHNLTHIAQVSAQYPHRQVELILSPEELGAVRMTLATTDAGTTMAIVADRPETLDLLRRNIDLLAQDFRDLGMGDVSFSFSAGTDRSAAGQEPPPQNSGDPPDRPDTPAILVASPSAPNTSVKAASGLDLRF